MIEPLPLWIYQGRPQVVPMRDALTSKQIQELRTNPLSAIHLSLPLSPQAAQAAWQQWITERLLLPDPLPAFYVYSQTFSLHDFSRAPLRRIGVVAGVPSEAPLLPHENILPERAAGIQRILEELPLQTAPVHLLVEAPWDSILPLLQDYLVCPLFSYSSPDGVMHQWTPIHHRGHQLQIQKALAEGRFYIADGHHRWAAVRQSKVPLLLSYLTPLQDNTLVIAPFHRLVRTKNAFLKDMEAFFEVRLSAAKVPLSQEIQGLRHAIGAISPEGETFTARLRPSFWHLLAEAPLAHWLHQWILSPFQALIEYIPDAASAAEAALAGEGWAFILPEVDIRYVKQAALTGKPLPPKTTYFFPKVLSGIVFYHAGDSRFGFAAA